MTHPQKVPQRGADNEILQWMESTIIQTSNQKNNGLAQQKEVANQGRSPSSFYHQATSQPTSPIGEKEQEKEFEESIFPNLQDHKNPERCYGKCLQHGQNIDGIQGQRRTKTEAIIFPKEINLSPDAVNTLTEIKSSMLPLKDIKESLSSLKEMKNSILSLTQIVVQNKKEIDNMNQKI
ncbi:hypothetical protein O181_082370 [Austropuccinia psidii MF-1]|uniref:Uncharacterized protein n=1 Tax=Austropuccinia psidii MF-1 TaxID=1389203 RepID=A0A9Q3FKZ5_9BASI|nr:hypothetical protein [Austropuccinia psidii MF-1]